MTLVPKHHFNLSATTLISSTPSTYHGALKDPNWFNAMREEYNALVDQNTWTLVPRLVGANVVTDKWIYRHKYQPDGSLARYKARWVVCGFSQPHGVDYEETLSPIIKPATILVVRHDQQVANSSTRCEECILTWFSSRDSLCPIVDRVCFLFASGVCLQVEQIFVQLEAGPTNVVPLVHIFLVQARFLWIQIRHLSVCAQERELHDLFAIVC
jgi:hypothetical protein